MEESFEVTIPADHEGFVTIQCPFCRKPFKLRVTDFEEDHPNEIACVHCGLWGEKSDFISDEAKEKVLREAENQFIRMLGSTFKKSGLNFESNFKENASKTIIESDMDKYIFFCCDKTVKADLITDTLYCPFCGGITNGIRS
jgi:uncharacterized protein YbaR (Trm112 family)